MYASKIFLCLFLTFVSLGACLAQSPVKKIPLDDMSAFKPQAGNWQVVGSVSMNPDVDSHHEEPAPAEPTSGKKKKKKNEQPAPVPPQAVTFQPGKGVLLNVNDNSKKDQLVTTWEHGDIELEFEVMLPKGSNSGVYLQGRYEVQLFDSWGVKDPKFSDIGGIYRNWENEPGKIYMGKAPLSNPSKAPGLWQTMNISFRAPKFDASGKKIANARFVYVELNGVTIHQNLEVPLPTGGPIENNEKATGPLVIQGDHGPVAFRNIRYRIRKESNVTISPITYSIFHGNYKTITDFATAKPFATGTSKDLTAEVIDIENSYGIIYKGTVTVPENDTYTFLMAYSGGSILTVNDEELINYQRFDGWRNDKASIELKAGTYPFEIYNFKDASWMPPRLRFGIETATTYPQTLSSYGSFPPDENPEGPILINAGSTPRLLRAFIDFKGDRKRRLTHTIGVGDPVGINYVYDLRAGNLVCVWRGNFVDATPMWHDRGDGSFRPVGAAQYLFTNQPLAYLSNETEAFPATGVENDFRGKGYSIEENTGRPVFHYLYKDLEVDEKVTPGEGNKSLLHDISIKSKTTPAGLYYKLAEGATITAQPNGYYAIDDQQYYIKVNGGVAPVIREVNGKKELVLKVSGNALSYSVIW